MPHDGNDIILIMRQIIDQSNPVLRKIAQEIPIKDIKNVRVRGLIRDMKKLLAKERYGVALAAPQVGESLRLFIVSGKVFAEKKSDGEEEGLTIPDDQIYINPVLKKVSRGKNEKHEGCLSIRGLWGEVPRSEKTTITAYDEYGKKFTRGASGFLAHIFQHEMDHLEGVLYTDKATKIYEEKDIKKDS